MEKLPHPYNYPLENEKSFAVNSKELECIGVVSSLTPSANEPVEVYYLHRHSAGDILHLLHSDALKPGQRQRVYSHEEYSRTSKPEEVPMRKEWLKSQQQLGLIPTIEEINASIQEQLRNAN